MSQIKIAPLRRALVFSVLTACLSSWVKKKKNLWISAMELGVRRVAHFPWNDCSTLNRVCNRGGYLWSSPPASFRNLQCKRAGEREIGAKLFSSCSTCLTLTLKLGWMEERSPQFISCTWLKLNLCKSTLPQIASGRVVWKMLAADPP